MDKGSIVIGGVTDQTICQSLDMAVKMSDTGKKTMIPEEYKEQNVSEKIVKIIQSYTDIVNRTVWRK